MIRKALPSDLSALLQLYTHLKEEPAPPLSDDLLAVWQSIMDDPKHHIIVAEVDETIVSSCVISVESTSTASSARRSGVVLRVMS